MLFDTVTNTLKWLSLNLHTDSKSMQP
jgi:hypothetical protein